MDGRQTGRRCLGNRRQRNAGAQDISEYRLLRRRSRNPDQQDIRSDPQASAYRCQEPDFADGRQRAGREIRRICRLPDRNGLRACSPVRVQLQERGRKLVPVHDDGHIEGTLGCMDAEGLFPETHVFLRNVERLGMIT